MASSRCRFALSYGLKVSRALLSPSRGGGIHKPKCGPFFTPTFQPSRSLSVHEYYSMQLLKEYGLNVPRGNVAQTPEEAAEIARTLGGDVVVKAQVLAGGRGKGHFTSGLQGGVQRAKSPQEALSVAKQMIGSTLITHQTGKEGRTCKKVLVCERKTFDNEFYFALLMDRAFRGPVMVASMFGGVNIEEVFKSSPDSIYTDPIDITKGLQKEQAKLMARRVGFGPRSIEAAADQMVRLYKLMIDKDATLVEINPMVQDEERVMCMDAKINFDDNAEYRQKEIFGWRDWSQEDPRDVAAASAGVNYIGLTGTIGCLVNGAGLAMATMDLIQLYGGEPANFLDIGGGATSKEVVKSFRIFNSDHNVSAIFVNIFGGITHCDEVAKGIIAATKELQMKTPIVVRLQGNKQKEAKDLINSSGLQLIAEEDLDKAAKSAVNVARIVNLAQEVSLNVDISRPKREQSSV
eukprot:Em0021g585a